MIDLSTPMLGPLDVAPIPDPRFFGGKYDDATVRLFWGELTANSQRYGFRTSIIAAQIAKETGWFRFGGDVPADAFNLAGLGATGGGVQGTRYVSIVQGVDAVFAHHLTYHYGTVDKWPVNARSLQSLDYRYDAVLSTGRAGTIHALGDFTNGVWAYSKQYPIGSLANGYATGIRDIANTLTTGGTPVADVPYDRTHWAADVGPKRDIAAVRWFVVHDTEGSFPGDESVLTDGGGPIESVHFLVGRVPGQCVYMVPLDTTAWTAGNDQVSEQAIQVELSRNPARGETDYTAYQYAKLAEIFNWCVAQGMVNVPAVYIGRRDADGGPEPDDPGIIGHQDVPDGAGGWGGSGHHTDPGPTFDWSRFTALIGTAPSPAQRLTDGHALGSGFTDYVAALDAMPNNVRLRDLGLCASDEYDGFLCSPVGGGRFKVASVVIANFERGRLLWDRGATAPPFDVRRPMVNELCGPADQPDVGAVLKNPDAQVN